MVNNYPHNLFSISWIKIKVIDFFDIIQPVFCRTIPFSTCICLGSFLSLLKKKKRYPLINSTVGIYDD
jgi:hypothetical protein